MVCKESFSEVASLKLHVKCHNKKKKEENEKISKNKGKDKKKVTCNECGFLFTDQQYVKHQNLCGGKFAISIIGDFVECIEGGDEEVEVKEETEDDVLQDVVQHSEVNSYHEITIDEFKIESHEDIVV